MKPSTRTILSVLRRAGPRGATGEELNKIAFRYGGRLFELRQAGYVIETQPGQSGGMWVYVLRSEPKGGEASGQAEKEEGGEAAEEGRNRAVTASPAGGGGAGEASPPAQGEMFGEYVRPWRG